MMSSPPPPPLQQPSSAERTSRLLGLFIIVLILCCLSSMNEIHLQNLVKIAQPTFFSNLSHNLMFSSNTPLEEASAPSSSPNIRLFIGILTRPDLYWRRHMIRLVYGIQSPLNAQIDIKFVFCNLTKEDQKVLVALEIMRFDDIIILNCAENMNNGKTYTYFSSLPELLDAGDGRSNPYDYVMKADDDIYFRLDQLVESLRPLPREDLYYGFVIPCNVMDTRGRYMAGMGYILSWDLVDWIGTSDIAKNHSEGTEDKLVGDWLKIGGRGNNRYNLKPAMYDYPIEKPKDSCSHEFIPETIAVHRLKDPVKWIKTLKYFNVTDRLKPSKFYHIP